MTTYRFDEMPTALDGTGLCAADRQDPFFGALFAKGTEAKWADRREVENGVFNKPPAWMRLQMANRPADALAKMTGKQRALRLEMLGAAGAWRTMTTEQLAAMLGSEELNTDRLGLVHDAWGARLLDDGVVRSIRPGMGCPAQDVTLVRPAKGRAFDDLAPMLTWAELVQVTGGVPWTTGRTDSAYHNVCATEFGLRVAELCDPNVAAVLGETLSSTALLGGGGDFGSKSGDLTIVRRDGLRIVVEVTNRKGAQLTQKVEAWARFQADQYRGSDSRGYDPNVFVLFLVLPRADSDNPGSVLTSTRAAIRQALGSMYSTAYDKFGVVAWEEFFPAAGVYDDTLFTLTVDVPTDYSAKEWEKVPLLNPTAVPTVPAAIDPTAILANLPTVPGVPFWLKPERTSWRPTRPILAAASLTGCAGQTARYGGRRRSDNGFAAGVGARYDVLRHAA